MADGSGGEPGGSYVHSSSVKDYLLAALEGEEAHDEGYDGYYYAWLKYVLRRLKVQEEGKMRRALLCACGCHLEAWDEEELVGEVLVHLGQEHPVMDQQQEAQVHERVATHSYRYEYVEEVYAGGAEPDEEFGLDPY